MADRDQVNNDTWLEFLGPLARPPGVGACCGLCGNSGIVDTRGKVNSPIGKDCGVLAFCICPNGRARASSTTRAKPEEMP